MAKQKYVFDQKTLSYERYFVNWKQRLLGFISYLLTTGTLAVAFVVIAYYFFGSPKERIQKREIDFMHLQYDILFDKFQKMEQLIGDMQERDDNIYRVIFEAEPIPSTVRQAGYGGVDRYEMLEGYNNSKIVTEAAQRLDRIASQLYVQSKSFDEVFDLAKRKNEMLASMPAIQPVKNTDLRRISSYYGVRLDPFYKVNKFHEGVDFSAPTGTEVFATGDGTVESVEKSYFGYGNMIVINHGYGYKTAYGHLSAFNVRKGEKVKRGQMIAKVGSTGKSTSPHLHYEVRKNNKAINPINFFFNDLSPESYQMILEMSLVPSQSMD
ncbi:MAG: M23 family metallopeptidase [Bacteroidales bacterium]|nr:M23 family metallopeptidase [Bacteroidales bacterium]